MDKLVNIPRIVEVYDTATRSNPKGIGYDILFIEEAADGNLKDEIDRREFQKQPYTEKELVDFRDGLVDTLAQVQERGVVHHDLKPAKVLTFLNGEYKL